MLTVGRNPSFDLATWDLRVDGEVERELTLSWDELMALPQTDVTVDIHCVTRWSKLDTTWRGVRVGDLLERAGVGPDGTHLMAHSDGGYTTNVPLDAVMRGRGARGPHLRRRAARARPRRAAAPARPEALLLEVGKFLRRLEVMSGDRMGFWELNGYHNDADPWQEQRPLVLREPDPSDADCVAPGRAHARADPYSTPSPARALSTAA